MAETASSTAGYLWFLDTLVSIRVSEQDSSDKISIIEHRAPYGDSPPLHMHHTEDEVFHILEGEFRFVVGGEERYRGPGEIFLAPKGIPHTYRVESSEGGRWLTITSKGDFERFVRALSRVAERAELPLPMGAPSPEAMKYFSDTASTYGIALVGPPLH